MTDNTNSTVNPNTPPEFKSKNNVAIHPKATETLMQFSATLAAAQHKFELARVEYEQAANNFNGCIDIVKNTMGLGPEYTPTHTLDRMALVEEYKAFLEEVNAKEEAKTAAKTANAANSAEGNTYENQPDAGETKSTRAKKPRKSKN